jgi:steroid 5-alpha reductase family enzyme
MGMIRRQSQGESWAYPESLQDAVVQIRVIYLVEIGGQRTASDIRHVRRLAQLHVSRCNKVMQMRQLPDFGPILLPLYGEEKLMAERTDKQIIIGIAMATAIGILISWAGSDGGDRFGVLPVFALCGALAFAVNWAAFIPAAIKQTEHYYDLIGGITYITITIVAVLLSSPLDLRSAIVTGMVLFWSIRLASFLFLRISRAGKDSRFDDIKNRPPHFLLAWTLQGLWALLTAACALAIITGGNREPLGIIGYIGIGVWTLGILIEIVADKQKSAFRASPANQGKFISTGLWAWSRHPNYFGEIVLWSGMAIIAIPVLQGWQWATVISPVFVAFLLTKVSGVPMLEKAADERWGGQDDYETYKQNTPVLVMKPPARDV